MRDSRYPQALAERVEARVLRDRLEQRVASEIEDPRVMQGAGLLQPLSVIPLLALGGLIAYACAPGDAPPNNQVWTPPSSADR